MGPATAGSGMPAQRLDAWSGRMNVTRLPACGPKHSPPCQATGLKSVPQPDRRSSARWSSPGFAVTTSISSSRVSVRPSSASMTASRNRFAVGGSIRKVALPGGTFPRPAGGQQREERTGVLGREQVEGPAHRPGLDEVTRGQALRPTAPALTAVAPDPDGKLGRRGDLGLDAGQPRTTSSIGRSPIGSSWWRRIRQARACAHPTSSTMPAYRSGTIRAPDVECAEGGAHVHDGRRSGRRCRPV